jgi:hypothetical protein
VGQPGWQGGSDSTVFACSGPFSCQRWGGRAKAKGKVNFGSRAIRPSDQELANMTMYRPLFSKQADYRHNLKIKT